MLWDPNAHEPLRGEWGADAARAAIRAIAADTEDAFGDGWPVHPADVDPGDPESWSGTYLGSAGVVDALRRLAERGFVELRRDYLPHLDGLPPDQRDASLMVGETGLALVRHRLSPSESTRERLRELVAANVGSDGREILIGSPGTMLVARELGFDEEWRASAERLLADRDPETGLWEQNLWGRRGVHLGAAHGFAGCVLAFDELDGAAEAARRHAVVEDGLANWPASADQQLVQKGTIRTQWCHGAPGMITAMRDALDEDLALAGGELTWRAGPLTKGGGLCHGTAGNGYALLTLFERTGDELWLDRARRFAVHSIGQVEHARAEHGMGRHSLWTGDPGTALFLADCIEGAGRLPLP
jgi:hypothetical protein